MLKQIYPYFDNNATTPLHPRVLEVLNEYQSTYFANPSSVGHPSGMICNALYKKNLQSIADILEVKESEIIFTSGSTESINTAIKGLYFQYGSQKNHIISCKTEHSAVLNTLKYLEEFHNASITLLDVNQNVEINLEDLEKSITNRTLMVCLMAANNETGLIHPMEEIYQITKKKKVLFFSDTTQIFGKTLMNKISADIFCGSAHKFYGPKGIGFLVIKGLGRKIFLPPLLHGGNQQSIRSGTLPLPLIHGMSTAFQIIYDNQQRCMVLLNELRNYFESQLKAKLNIYIHSEKANRISNTSNILFSENDYEKILKAMNKFCFSRASACSDGSGQPSHVLSAMGFQKDEINRSFRFSFSIFNTKEEIDNFMKFIINS
ncbi:MAG: cysteine desulfurase family protein [Bacteroidota bacterium]